MKLTASLVAEAVGARVTGSLAGSFTGVTTDSRQVGPGQLFVALAGPNFDGHDFIPSALSQGALGVIASKEVAVPAGAACFQVADTLQAYQSLARAYRRQFKQLKVFAITGSNGKTSTKDLLAACLASKYRVVKTQGNFNNEIGLPKTLFTIEQDTDFAVVEMGMRGLGQIRELCAIAQPDAGLITNVGETHMELLGSMENIAKAKGEIVEGLPAAGYAVLNGDNPYALQAAARTQAQVVTFGLGGGCDYRGSHITTSALGSSFTCTERSSGRRVEVRLQLIGEHNVYNALSAIAGAACYGVGLEAAAKALSTARLTGSRQELVYIGPLTFINDAYNASPASMEAALKTLAEAVKVAKGRGLAVLSDMTELGSISQAAHRRVGRWVAQYGVDELVAYGPESAYLAEEAGRAGVSVHYYPSRAEAAAFLRQLVQPGDVILLKGSRTMQVDKMLDLFK